MTATPPDSAGERPDPAGTTVLVVDDHPMWRDGLARDLGGAGFSVVATADSVAAAAARGAATRPAVAIVDMNLPDGNGAAATLALLAVSPSTQVLILSASDERDDVLDAIKAGATGYLVKSASAQELFSAVEATAAGQAVFTPGLAGLVLGEFRRIARDPGPQTPALTTRETEVLRFVATGLSARQIGTRLGVSHRTVENHVQSTLRKLQLGNRVELTRYAVEHGLVIDPQQP